MAILYYFIAVLVYGLFAYKVGIEVGEMDFVVIAILVAADRIAMEIDGLRRKK